MKLWMILLLEIVLPGGTLVATALMLYRHRKDILPALSIRRPSGGRT